MVRSTVGEIVPVTVFEKEWKTRFQYVKPRCIVEQWEHLSMGFNQKNIKYLPGRIPIHRRTCTSWSMIFLLHWGHTI